FTPDRRILNAESTRTHWQLAPFTPLLAEQPSNGTGFATLQLTATPTKPNFLGIACKDKKFNSPIEKRPDQSLPDPAPGRSPWPPAPQSRSAYCRKRDWPDR